MTTDSNHRFNIAPNLLDRDFAADRPNQKWAGDISYVWTIDRQVNAQQSPRGARRLVVSRSNSRPAFKARDRPPLGDCETITCRSTGAVSNRMKRDLAIRALKMAIAFRAPPKGCIHHTDRGSQYCSHDYQKILRQHGFRVSMSGKGNCYEFKLVRASGSNEPVDHLKAQNAAVETFFKTIKAELIWRRPWDSRRQAEMAIFQYINGFYNPRRRHSALGWRSPVAFERKVA